MNVKIDTKEKFTVITPNEAEITANMTGELGEMLRKPLNNSIPHVILNMKYVQIIDKEACDQVVRIQQEFYEANHSFVICELSQPVKAYLDSMDYVDNMNITPTESEAWDIVQMEEIERELLGDDPF